MSSPTQRTLQLLRRQGYNPQIVERFNSWSGQRSDLFHIIDILILTPKSVIGIQSTGTDFSGHKKKLMEEEKDNSFFWLSTKGTELFLIGWRKVKKARTGKMMIYKPRIARVTIQNKELNFQEVTYQWLRQRKKKKNLK